MDEAVGTSCDAGDTQQATERTAITRPTAIVSFGSSYTRAVVERALTAAGWRVLGAPAESEDQPPSLWWAEFTAVHWDAVLAGTTCASTQYLRSGLVRKADLLHYMQKHKLGHRFPRTVAADIEDEEDIEGLLLQWRHAADLLLREEGYTQESPALWLLKPSRANRGEGIAVLLQDDEPALRAALNAFPQHKEWLLQRYVVPLLLPPAPTAPPVELPASPPVVDGLKFHLRWHVLAVGALSVWVHDSPLVLLSSVPWQCPDTSVVAKREATSAHRRNAQPAVPCATEEDRMLVHLTNHAQQVRSDGYDEACHTRSLHEAVAPDLAASLQAQARAIAADAFAPFARGTAAFFALPHCFEIYGFDLAVDTSGRAWLLEVNSGPDLSLHGTRLAHVADKLVGDAERVVSAYMYRGCPLRGVAAAMGDAEEEHIATDDAAAGDAADRHNSGAIAAGTNGAAKPPSVGEGIGGFQCVLSRGCDSPRDELDRFKRSMSTIGRFAHSLHEAAGAPVRGVQARAMAASTTSASAEVADVT